MTTYSRISLILICFLTAFTPLARGSVHMWAVTLMQTGVMICMGLLLVESLRLKRPLMPDTPLTRPLAAALFLAVFGLFKWFGLNPFTFWQYPELSYSPTFLSATFGNHNHLAGFLEMALPFLLALFLTRTRQTSILFVLVYLALLLLTAQALSLSRGGWLATLASLCFMGACLLSQRRFGSKKLILGIGAVTLLVSIVILAATPIVERIMTLTEQDPAATMEGRLIAYAGTLDLIRDHFLTGTGPGTYAVAFPRYQPPGLGALYDHAHNDYLEFISDLGIGIIPILIWIMVLFFQTGFKNQSHPSRQTRGFSLACMTATAAILVHSFGDFNLQIPSNAFLFTIILGLLTRHKTPISGTCCKEA